MNSDPDLPTEPGPSDTCADAPDGILDEGGKTCCPASCGQCGGSGCATRPGGASACCTGVILDSGVSCSGSKPPCILGEAPTPDPGGEDAEPEKLYTKKGSDPTWEHILKNNMIPVGEQSTDGIRGSTIEVNRDLVETGPNANHPIIADLKIHTVGHAAIGRKDFGKWTRWYQEHGNTQVFRLFEGETNVRNARTLAARIEAFSPSHSWLPKPGVWHEFNARYTIVEARGCSTTHTCSIFQAKGNNVDHWSVMIRLDPEGNIWMHRREDEDFIMAENMVGKSFDLRVRDNGLDYEVYLDGVFQGDGQWRRTAAIGFRWGIYLGASEVSGPIMVLVTGARAR